MDVLTFPFSRSQSLRFLPVPLSQGWTSPSGWSLISAGTGPATNSRSRVWLCVSHESLELRRKDRVCLIFLYMRFSGKFFSQFWIHLRCRFLRLVNILSLSPIIVLSSNDLNVLIFFTVSCNFFIWVSLRFLFFFVLALNIFVNRY